MLYVLKNHYGSYKMRKVAALLAWIHSWMTMGISLVKRTLPISCFLQFPFLLHCELCKTLDGSREHSRGQPLPSPTLVSRSFPNQHKPGRIGRADLLESCVHHLIFCLHLSALLGNENTSFHRHTANWKQEDERKAWAWLYQPNWTRASLRWPSKACHWCGRLYLASTGYWAIPWTHICEH